MTFNHIVINSSDKIRLVNYEDITSICANGSYSYFNIKSEKKISTCKTLSQLSKELPDFFFRSHRSCFVNLYCIDSIDKSRLVILLSDGNSIPIAKNKISELVEILHG